MPRVCPLGLNPPRDTVQVEKMATSTNQLWIAEEAVPWFVSYLATQARCGGIPEVDEEDDTPNCEVAGLRLSWDFQTNDTWKAAWVNGPLEGETVSISVSNFTDMRFQQSAPAVGIEKLFSYASPEDLKTAARRFLLDHCKAQLAQHRNGGDSPR